MKRHPPHPSMTISIPMDTFKQLTSASVATVFEKEDWEIAALAIREWMVRNQPDSFKQPAKSGYQWKNVFLPSGTLLRTVFKGKNYHCHVEQDELLHDGQASTPNKFIATVGGVRRSAWRSIWVLLPGAALWKRAADLRPADRPVPTRRRF